MTRPPASAILHLFLLCGVLTAAVHAQALVEEYRFGAFTSASRIETDPFERILVTDEAQHTISCFSAGGILLHQSGGQGWDTNQFDHPRGIDARLGLGIYVADMGNHRIVRLDRTLAAVGTFSTIDDPVQEQVFRSPLDVASSKLGTLFILDGENKQVVSTNGFAAVERTFGSIDAGGGRLEDPVALTLDDEDNVFVLERGRVVVFDGFGAVRQTFGTGILENARGIAVRGDVCAVVSDSAIFFFSRGGSLLERMDASGMLCAGPAGAFRDIALTDRFLLLLTVGNVIVFPHSFTNHNK